MAIYHQAENIIVERFTYIIFCLKKITGNAGADIWPIVYEKSERF